MTGLVLSIVVLATGIIVQTVEAKRPNQDDPKSWVKLSCNDRKFVLSCKVTSRDQIDGYMLDYIDDGELSPSFDGICARSWNFEDPYIKSGTYVVTVDKCDTNIMATFTITVNEKLKITSTVQS